jgi:hypothetical protein
MPDNTLPTLYSKAQYDATLKQVQTEAQTYSADSVKKARERWQDARETREGIEAGTIEGNRFDARESEAQAKAEFDKVQRYSGHLEARQREQERETRIEAQRVQAQQEQAATEKAAFKARIKEHWLANGGSANAFEARFEEMWSDEVYRRMQHGGNSFIAKLRASGVYGLAEAR